MRLADTSGYQSGTGVMPGMQRGYAARSRAVADWADLGQGRCQGVWDRHPASVRRARSFKLVITSLDLAELAWM